MADALGPDQPTGRPDTSWDDIRLAFVAAGVPLEVLIGSGWLKHFTPDLQESIHQGAAAVRDMLRRLT